VGFDNGIIRVLMTGKDNFDILKSFKAHDNSIIKVKYTPDGTMMATASADGEVFFFTLSDQTNLQ
jgi:WD40 repeat protein